MPCFVVSGYNILREAYGGSASRVKRTSQHSFYSRRIILISMMERRHPRREPRLSQSASKYFPSAYCVSLKVVGTGADLKKSWPLPLSCSQFNDKGMMCSWIGTECFSEDWKENLFYVSIVNWMKSSLILKWEWGVCMSVCVCVCVLGAKWWERQGKRKEMLRRPTKFYTTEDIKYDIGRKAVAELASHNSLEKVSWKGLGKKYLWPLHQCKKYR